MTSVSVGCCRTASSITRLFSWAFLIFAFVPIVLALGPVHAKTVLVTGSNRGIGLEFVNQYARAGWDVIATSRSPEDDEALKALATEFPKIVIEPLDVTNLEQIASLAAKYEGTAIDILLNNAGTLGRQSQQKNGGSDRDAFLEIISINAFGPMKITEAFTEHVAASDEKKVIAISSYNGSISSVDPSIGARPYYGISKTTLNMAMRGIAMNLKKRGVIVGILHPGGVNTRMTRQSYGRMSPEEAEAALDFKFPGFTLMMPEESVSKMITTIESLDLDRSGDFLRYDGAPLPW